MNGEWCYFNHYFDKTACEKIIADAADIPTQDGILGTGDATTGNIDSSIDGSTAATGTNLLFRVTALIPDTTTAAGLYTEVVVKFNGTWHQQLSTVGTAPA